MARGRLTWIKPGRGAHGARGYAAYLASHEAAGTGAMGGLARYYGHSRLVRSVGTIDEADLGEADEQRLEAWLAWLDPETGESRGEVREETTVAVELTVNHSKGYDVAALLGEDAAVALAAAHERACRAVRRTVAREAVTRRRIDGVVTVVPAGGLEWALTTHATSRAGDPELHTHMALLSRVRADGASGWYAVWTTPLRASWHLAQTVADVTLACDPGLRRALGARGLVQRIDEDGTAHVDALEDAGRVLSKRHEQIARMREQMTAEWREAHGGAEPDAEAMRGIDQVAWARTRKSKTVETATPDPDAWRAELAAAGHDLSRYAAGRAGVDAGTAPVPDAQAVAWAALDMLSASSAVSLLDAERAVWVAVGRSGVVAGEDGLRRIVDAAMPVVRRRLECLVPDAEAAQAAPWVRAWTTPAALRDEAELTLQLRALGEARVGADRAAMVDASGLDRAQEDAARAVAGDAGLVVVTGAAGSGKTTMLRAACRAMDGEPLLVSPTARGAQEMAAATGAQDARTVAGLLRRAGLWDPEAGYAPLYDVRTGELRPPASACLPGMRGRTIIVDEAGMLEQAAAWRLAVVARCSGARLVLVGDQAQLGAVGRGGVMGIARGLCAPGATATLDVLHRYEDPSWAALTLDARAGKEGVAERLAGREADPVPGLECAGALCWGDDKRIAGALARAWMDGRGTRTDGSDTLVSCTTNAQARAVNRATQALRLAAGELSGDGVPGMDGDRIHAGDIVQTRLNAPRLGVCNRDRWTVRAVREDGSLDLEAPGRHARVPADYAGGAVQLAYATTTYGCQGATARHAIHWAAQGAGSEDIYVGMTRGARSQRIVVTADTRDEAVEQVAQSLASSRADLGITTARAQAIADLDATPPVAPHTPAPSPAPGPEPADPDDEPDTDDAAQDDEDETQKMRRYLVTHKDELYGLDLSGQDLHGLDLSGADMRGTDLTTANLSGATLRGALLDDALLDGATLTDADMRRATLTDATLSGANMTMANLSGARLDGAVLTDATLTDALLDGAVLTDADMSGAYCYRADMRSADLTGARLDADTDMTDVLLDGATLDDMTMTDTQETPAPTPGTTTPGMGMGF